MDSLPDRQLGAPPSSLPSPAIQNNPVQIQHTLHAAISTPAVTYVVEAAEEPPIFSNNGHRFFEWDAKLHTALPAGGPIHGGTLVELRGRGLQALATGERARCRFGMWQALATVMEGGVGARCLSPSTTAAGEVELSLSLNSDDDHSNDWTQPLRFIYYDVKPLALHPTSGVAYQSDFAITAGRSALALGLRAVQLSAANAPLSEYKIDGMLPAPLTELLASIGEMPSPILLAITPMSEADMVAAEHVHGALLVLAAADCSLHAFHLSSTMRDSLSAKRLEGHGSKAVGDMLKAAGAAMCAPTFGDLDGDGAVDMLVGVGSGRLYAYRNLARAVGSTTYVPWEQQGHGQQEGAMASWLHHPLSELAKTAVVDGRARPVLVDADTDVRCHAQLSKVPRGVRGRGSPMVLTVYASFNSRCI